MNKNIVYASTSDYGQRYVLRAKDYPQPGWQDVLFSNNLTHIELAKDGLLLAPDCTETLIVDRDIPLEDAVEAV